MTPQDRGDGQPDRRGAQPHLHLARGALLDLHRVRAERQGHSTRSRTSAPRSSRSAASCSRGHRDPAGAPLRPQEIPIVSLALRSDTRTPARADHDRRRDDPQGARGRRGRRPGDDRRRREARDRGRARSRPARRARRHRRARSWPRSRAENMEVPAGRLELGPGEKLVRVAGRLREAGRLRQAGRRRRATACRSASATWPRRIDDAEEARSAAMFNGIPAIGIDIRKVSGANTVEVAEQVKKKVEELRKRLPDGVELVDRPRQLGVDPRLRRGRQGRRSSSARSSRSSSSSRSSTRGARP